MQFVNVGLYSIEDSTLVKATVTDIEGRFKLRGISTGLYYAECSFIGFEHGLSDKLVFAGHSENQNIGSIKLQADALALDAVEIKGQKTASNFTIDRKVYNVAQDVMAQSSNATQMLANIPSITVDVDGQVSLRGTSNVTFFINGRPSTLMRLNSAMALQQIPATNIERIEVITNPSAKYKPDGAGGIINIVLKKDTERGTNSSIRMSVGNNQRYTGNISFNYVSDKTNIYGSCGLRHSSSPRLQTDSRVIKDSLEEVQSYYHNNTTTDRSNMTHMVNGGFDHQFNDKNRFELMGNIFTTKGKRLTHINTMTHDEGGHLTSSFLSTNTRADTEIEYELNTNFEHQFGEDQILSISTNYANYHEVEDVYFTDLYDKPEGQSTYLHNLTTKYGPLANFYAEYSTPLLGGDFESGYVYERFRDNIDFLLASKPDEASAWQDDGSKSYLFIFTQQIHALYSTYSNSVGKFGYMAGLHAEQALVESNLANLDSMVSIHYFKLYPTLHFTYKINDQQQFQINYSRRVRRADSDEYNPLPDYKSSREIEAGNPKLLPEQIHSVEVGYELKKEKYSVVSSLYYRQKFDGFTRVNSFVNDSILLRTYVNLTSEKASGTELILSSQITQAFEFDLNFNGYHNTIDASGLGYSGSKSAFSWNVKISARVYLSPSTFLQVNPNYRSIRITPQGYQNPVFVMNCGLKQDMFNKKSSLTLTVSDVFNTLRRQIVIDTPYLQQHINYKRKSRLFSVGFVYKFGGVSKGERDLQYDNSL